MLIDPQKNNKRILSQLFLDTQPNETDFNKTSKFKNACQSASRWGTTSKDHYATLQEWVIEAFPGRNTDKRTHKGWGKGENTLAWGQPPLFRRFIDFCCNIEAQDLLVYDKRVFENNRTSADIMREAVQNFKQGVIQKNAFLALQYRSADTEQPDIAGALFIINFFKRYLGIKLLYSILDSVPNRSFYWVASAIEVREIINNTPEQITEAPIITPLI